MIANIVYSNSSYYDVLDIFLERWRAFYDKDITIFSDTLYKEEATVIYNSHLNYSGRLLSCLDKLDADVILYQHEDMFLYKTPNAEKLNQYADILQNSDKSFIRLTKAGTCVFSQSDLSETLLNISPQSGNFFAVQSSLWKRKDLMEFLKEAGSVSIWDLEANSAQINCKRLFLNGLSHFDNEKLRGQQHHDSDVWPYIATAICKGKWNFLEYAKELSAIQSVIENKRERFQ